MFEYHTMLEFGSPPLRDRRRVDFQNRTDGRFLHAEENFERFRFMILSVFGAEEKTS